jgi:hypothetical protein
MSFARGWQDAQLPPEKAVEIAFLCSLGAAPSSTGTISLAPTHRLLVSFFFRPPQAQTTPAPSSPAAGIKDRFAIAAVRDGAPTTLLGSIDRLSRRRSVILLMTSVGTLCRWKENLRWAEARQELVWLLTPQQRKRRRR